MRNKSELLISNHSKHIMLKVKATVDVSLSFVIRGLEERGLWKSWWHHKLEATIIREIY